MDAGATKGTRYCEDCKKFPMRFKKHNRKFQKSFPFLIPNSVAHVFLRVCMGSQERGHPRVTSGQGGRVEDFMVSSCGVEDFKRVLR
jgi:hypothetical protein